MSGNLITTFVSSSRRVARQRVSRRRIEKAVSIRALDTPLARLLGRYSTRTIAGCDSGDRV